MQAFKNLSGTIIASYATRHWFPLTNAILLFYFVPVQALLLYFSVSALFILIRNKLYKSPYRDNLEPNLTRTIIVLLTLAALLIREPWLFLPITSHAGVGAWMAFTVGISYCWLRVIYIINIEQEIRFISFAKYYFFFPSYLSGPVISAEDFNSQKISLELPNIFDGFLRILVGGLRFLLSALVQQIVPFTGATEMQFALENFGALELWCAAFGSGVWLYLNFSAFSDIYIGLAKITGITLPENFKNPFASTNLTDFWQRWHISLGNWLRVNVFSRIAKTLQSYFPPGSIFLAGISATMTMVVCGLWHKIEFGYFIWGLMHGIGLSFHQFWRAYLVRHIPANFVNSVFYQSLAWFLTQAYVAIGWCFFFPLGRTDGTLGLNLVSRMFGI